MPTAALFQAWLQNSHPWPFDQSTKPGLGRRESRVRPQRRGRRSRQILLLPVFSLAGCFLFLSADRAETVEYALRDSGSPAVCTVCARIRRVEQKTASVWVYLDEAQAYFPGTDAALTGSHPLSGVIWNADYEPAFPLGSRVTLTGSLSLFDEAANPGVFDFASYYKARGFRYRLSAGSCERTGSGYDRIAEFFRRLRKRLAEGINAAAFNPEDAGILRAVFLGETGEVSGELRDLYRAAGAAHLLSVSGLHISFFALSLWRLVRRLTGSYPAALLAGGFAACFYGILTGGSIPAVRAVICSLLMMTANARGRVYDPANALGAAALVIALINPLSVFESSFLLSFGGVFGIHCLSGIFRGFLKEERHTAVLKACSMQLGLLPAVLWFYYSFPLYSMVLNQLILPASGFLLGASALTSLDGSILAAAVRHPGMAAHVILACYEKLCRFFTDLPMNRIVTGRPAAWRLGFAGLGWFILYLCSERCRERHKRIYSAETVPDGAHLRSVAVHFAAVLILSAGVLFLRPDPVRDLRITMLDIGQGDSVLIESPEGYRILSDGGSSSKKQAGTYILEPVLLSRGIERLDGVFLSHADQDHVNAVTELLERGNVAVDCLFLPGYAEAEQDFGTVLAAARRADCRVAALKRGDAFRAGALGFSILAPGAGEHFSDTNDSSLVWTLSFGAFDMLFTGDISSARETDAVPEMKIEVLKAPHHGSRFSSSEEWLRRLNPPVVLISAGRNNSYGHPHKEMLSRLDELGCAWYLTAESGAVTVESDGIAFRITPFRKPARK